MPRHLPCLPAVLAASFVVSATAQAAEKSQYQCRSGDIVRRIIIEVGDLGTSLPCEVVYWKDTEAPGVRRVLWNARTDAAFCADKASGLAEKLSSSGWQCTQSGADTASTQASLQPPTAAGAGNQTLGATVPSVDAATTASQAPVLQPAPSYQPAPATAAPQIAPGTSSITPAAPEPAPATTASLNEPSQPLPPEADDQLQTVINENLTSLNQQVDGDFEAEIGKFGDLNADGWDDAVVLFHYEASAADYTQFVAAYIYKEDKFHLAATKPVGGTERAVQKVEVEDIINGSIQLKLHLNDASQTEGRRAAMTLKDGQLVEIE